MDFEKEFKYDGNGRFLIKNCKTHRESGYKKKKELKKEISKDIKKLSEMQDKLYAQDKHAVLLVFQAMDAAGKDGTIRHVMSGVNPQGCHVVSFKAPSKEDLDHDYLWRIHKSIPERGKIGIFNRSYYEEVLVTKVHPEILLGEKIPGINKKSDINKKFWDKRYADIVNYENYLSDNGITIVKFFLHVSKDEQKKRFIERIDNPEKNWKFSEADVKERAFWNDYQKAFEDAIGKTGTEQNPWYIIPADDKGFMRLAVSKIINERISRLKLSYPEVSEETKANLQIYKERLNNDE